MADSPASPGGQLQMIAQAHGWATWQDVIEASQRDGYTEAGGTGRLAVAIALEAAYAHDLLELVHRYRPKLY